MKLKSSVLRRPLTVAAKWKCTEGYLHNGWLMLTNGDHWYRLRLTEYKITGDAKFSMDEYRTAVSPTRGNIEIMLTPITLTIGMHIVSLEEGHIPILPPDLMGCPFEHQLTFNGITWKNFTTKTAAFDGKELKDDTKGILIDGSTDKVGFVSSDGFSLFHYQTDEKGNGLRVLLTHEDCELWQCDDDFLMMFYENYVSFAHDGEAIIVPIVMQTFPEYLPLIQPGPKTMTFNVDSLAFVKGVKADYLNVHFHKANIVFEWYDYRYAGEAETYYNGEQKFNAECELTGRVTFHTNSVKYLLNFGPIITIHATDFFHAMTVQLGGFTYVWKGTNGKNAES